MAMGCLIHPLRQHLCVDRLSWVSDDSTYDLPPSYPAPIIYDLSLSSSRALRCQSMDPAAAVSRQARNMIAARRESKGRRQKARQQARFFKVRYNHL